MGDSEAQIPNGEGQVCQAELLLSLKLVERCDL
jgi:hypothetical protein